MKLTKNKKAAMEMSVGTIVTIVLLMTVLILGLVMIRTIFGSAKGAIDLTDQQLKDELNKAFGSEDKKISVYPSTRFLEMRQEETDGFGLGIRNALQGVGGTSLFSYEVVASDPEIEDKCGITGETAESWIVTGKSETDIPIPAGDYSSQKILFEIPTGAPLCVIRFRVNVKNEEKAYATDFFDLKIK